MLHSGQNVNMYWGSVSCRWRYWSWISSQKRFCQSKQDIFHPGKVRPSNVVLTSDWAKLGNYRFNLAGHTDWASETETETDHWQIGKRPSRTRNSGRPEQLTEQIYCPVKFWVSLKVKQNFWVLFNIGSSSFISKALDGGTYPRWKMTRFAW